MLVDLNLVSCREDSAPSAHFYSVSTNQICALRPDCVALTSMGVNAHVSLELARLIKSRRPKTQIVLGGPHFASTADRCLSAFPWIDFVAVGAAEQSFHRLISSLRDNRPLESPIVNAQDGNQRVCNEHPWSSYGLLSLDAYFEANDKRVLNFETGRGCKYRCTFCYSPSHWSASREQPVDTVVQDFQRAATLNADHLFLVQDNFFNDPARAHSLCQALGTLNKRPKWSCYGTIRDIHPAYISSLAAAGCTSVYIGLDAASSMQMKLFAKPTLASAQRRADTLTTLLRHGIVPTCAFICDPFRWPNQELEASFRAAVQLRVLGCQVSLHILSRYPGTRLRSDLEQGCRATDFRVRTMLDCPLCVQENPYAAHHPDLFPFHVIPADAQCDPIPAILLMHAAQELITEYPFELLDLLEFTDCSLIQVLQQVLRHIGPHARRHPGALTLKEWVADAFETLARRHFASCRPPWPQFVEKLNVRQERQCEQEQEAEARGIGIGGDTRLDPSVSQDSPAEENRRGERLVGAGIRQET